MAGEKSKKLLKGKSTVYVSLPSRRTRSGGQMKTEERIKASAEKTVRKALVEGRVTLQLGSHTHVFVGGLIPTTHPEHVAALFASCGRILSVEFVCTRGTADLQEVPLPTIPPEPILGQFPTPRRTLPPRYIEENQNKIMRQTWMYAIVRFDDAAAATRALAKNGATLNGLANTRCIIRVVTSTSDLEERHAVNDVYAVCKQGTFPSERGLTREETHPLIPADFEGRKATPRAKGQAESKGSGSSTETLRAKATVGRVRWLQSESTVRVRPAQKAAFGAFLRWWEMGLKLAIGSVSFKVTVA